MLGSDASGAAALGRPCAHTPARACSTGGDITTSNSGRSRSVCSTGRGITTTSRSARPWAGSGAAVRGRRMCPPGAPRCPPRPVFHRSRSRPGIARRRHSSGRPWPVPSYACPPTSPRPAPAPTRRPLHPPLVSSRLHPHPPPASPRRRPLHHAGRQPQAPPRPPTRRSPSRRPAVHPHPPGRLSWAARVVCKDPQMAPPVCPTRTRSERRAIQARTPDPLAPAMPC